MSRRQKPNLEEDLEEYREWLEKDIPINGDWIEEINCHSYEMRSIKYPRNGRGRPCYDKETQTT